MDYGEVEAAAFLHPSPGPPVERREAAIKPDCEQQPFLVCQSSHLLRLGDVVGKWLVYIDVHACSQARRYHVEVGLGRGMHEDDIRAQRQELSQVCEAVRDPVLLAVAFYGLYPAAREANDLDLSVGTEQGKVDL